MNRAAPPSVTEVVNRYFETINAEDWAGLVTLWQEDATLTAVGARPRTGHDEIVGFFQKAFAPWDLHDDQPTRMIVDGDAVAVEVEFHGVLPDGREVRFPAVDVMDIVDGRIARLTNWYDIAFVRNFLAG